MQDELELAPYKKRAKKNVPKKIDHKHDNETIVTVYRYRDTSIYHLTYRCRICGKMKPYKFLLFEKDIESILNKYEVVEVDKWL